MKIHHVKTSRSAVDFAPSFGSDFWGSNKVDLITGPNGSGKTEILASLAGGYRRGANKDFDFLCRWEDSSGRVNVSTSWRYEAPSRVIAQTFSPFNRFPKPNNEERSLSNIYIDEVVRNQNYICAGLNKSSRIVGGSLSKHTVEQAIFEFSENMASAEAALKMMDVLGFRDAFTLIFDARPSLKRVVDGIRQFGLEGFFDRLATDRYDPAYKRYLGSLRALRNELKMTDWRRLAELLDTSLRFIGPTVDGHESYELDFSFTGARSSTDYATLQSLSLLRRLDLLSLRSCEIADRYGKKFDIASASSGQQQMLCSIIGLVAALRDNSLVLIDEPELSLHPRWQQLYLSSLRAALMPLNGCHVLIATHSPLIVQAGQDCKAGIIQLGDEGSQVLRHEHASVEGTLMDVFDTPVRASTQLAAQIFKAISEAESGEVGRRLESEKELARLKTLYSDPQFGESEELHLINDAISLLSESAQG